MTRSAEHPVRILPSPFASIVASACIALSACASLPMSSTPATVDFIVVRHAEKETGAAVGQDPALTPAGRARAAAIAQALADAPVAAVYSTDYARTRETALPTAQAHGLEVVTYDAREPAETLAARLRASHATGTVLVVGHSNTVPAIAAALCGCDVPAMDETEYDRRLVVAIDADGNATLASDRQPAATR